MTTPETIVLKPGECVRLTLGDGRTVVGRMAAGWSSSAAALLALHVDHAVMKFSMDKDGMNRRTTVERIAEADVNKAGCCGGDRRRYESDGAGGYMPVPEPAEPREDTNDGSEDTEG